MRCRLITVRADPFDLGLQQCDTLVQLFLRIGRKVLAREEAGVIALGPGTVVFHDARTFHRGPVAVNRGER